MSVFLTPELKPFYGGTYFPPSSRWGRPGFVDLLIELARGGRRRGRVNQAAVELFDQLRLGRATANGSGRPVSPP